MKEIALWGFGGFGKRVYEGICRSENSDLLVSRIYDKKEQGIVSSPASGWEAPKAADPAFVTDDYKAGHFEAVMICLSDPAESDKVRRILGEAGIPEFLPGTETDFAGPAELGPLNEEDMPFRIEQRGYALYLFRDMAGVLPDYGQKDCLCLFRENGRILSSVFDRYEETAKDPLKYTLPLKVQSAAEKKSRLPGSWCVLSAPYAGNYWHFVFECMDRVCLLEEAGFRGNYLINDVPFCEELLLLYGVDPLPDPKALRP